MIDKSQPIEGQVSDLVDCVDALERKANRLPQLIKIAMGVAALFFVALVIQSISQNNSLSASQHKSAKLLVRSQRVGCIRAARHTVDGLNKDFAIYTADVTDDQEFRHSEAAKILQSDLDIASSLDIGTLKSTPPLLWPAMRARVKLIAFRCKTAYPAPAP